ncbi:LCP family protein [Streptomyces katsurahamanus]|uniref:LCP family protein n=1 Tax=Streptomyces katsurahamanus TaxID=2577098 RepID=UPI002B1EF254|nr:LCP family protein [Streptomyces katsurahamanus]
MGRNSVSPAPGGGHRSSRRRAGAQGGTRRARRGKGRRRVLRWSATVLSVLILATGAAGYLYYEHLNSKIKKDRLNLGRQMPDHKPNSQGQTPLNILVIGSDARDTKANQKLGGAKETFNAKPLADVQMLLHLSADRSNISVVSMPRDTMLRIPECKDPKSGTVYPASDWIQTNQSLGRGGPGCTVATWHELTGITIDHFMMIDFAGVVSMADAIGGVPVCVTDNIYSRNDRGQGSYLRLEEGTTHVKGKQALQWLRTRYGFDDGTDLARTRAQHMYMNSMVRELRKNAKLTDPNKLRKLAEAAVDALTVDEELGSVPELLGIGNELKSVPTKRITMAKMPSEYSTRPGFTSKVVPKPGDAEKLFRLVREDVPLDGKGTAKKKKASGTVSKDPAAAPAEIPVQVRNGTGGDGQLAQKGRASEVTALLQAKGFALAVADPTVSPQQKTVVHFSNAELEGDAQAAAKALGIPLSAVKQSTAVTGIALTVGADWRLGDVFPKADDDDKTPSTAEALRGDDSKACMKVQPGFTW